MGSNQSFADRPTYIIPNTFDKEKGLVKLLIL